MGSIDRQPLFQQIADILRREIVAHHQVGDRLGSDLALARRFSVSNVTIREAMLSLVQVGIVQRRHGSGTYVADARPAARPPAGRHVAIWTELDIAEPRTSSFYSRIIQDLKVFFEERQVAHQLYLGRRKPWEALRKSSCPQLWEDIKAHRLSGIVGLGANPLWLESLESATPVVGWIDRYPHRVTMDYTRMMRSAVKHLLSHGRRKIMMLRWDFAPSPADAHELVGRAFETVMRENDAAIRPAWVRSDLHPSRDGAGWEEFQKIWTSNREKPDGLIVSDDLLFRDVAMAILAMGIHVPDDLMVVTHANKGSGLFYPFPTTRIELDVDRAAGQMGQMLLDLMEGKGQNVTEVEVPLAVVEAGSRSRPARQRSIRRKAHRGMAMASK